MSRLNANARTTAGFLAVVAMLGVLYGTAAQRDRCIELHGQDPAFN